MSIKVIVFGGTSEGREISRMLADAGVHTRLCVATAYGEELAEPGGALEVTARRLDAREIAFMIQESGCGLVIDATHPYAREVTANVRAACTRTGVELLRLTRGRWAPEDVIQVENARQAAAILNKSGEKALLAVGSKELAAFTRVRDYKTRLFARVLPSVDALQKCNAMGFSGSHLICMQGPFTHDVNAAMIKMLGVSCVVTKESGHAGGLFEKISAARETGCRLILIRRPEEPEQGVNFDAVCALLCEQFGISPGAVTKNMAEEKPPMYFPLFVDLHNKRAVIVGGGGVACRRAKTLLKFGAKIHVIAPDISPETEELVRDGKITWLQSEFAPPLLEGADIVIAATDSREVNRAVGEEARRMRVLVSVADRREECGFLFPAIVQTDNLVAGFVTTDNDHAALKRAARIFRERLNGGRS